MPRTIEDIEYELRENAEAMDRHQARRSQAKSEAAIADWEESERWLRVDRNDLLRELEEVRAEQDPDEPPAPKLSKYARKVAARAGVA